VADGFGGAPGGLLARALGCAQTEASGSLETPGATVAGFRVASAEPPARLYLEGRHRFSTYALDFDVDAVQDTRSRLSATTRAEFPGLRGRAYRALVIGSRAHVVLVNRMLRSMKRRAERAAS
jgi:hypothetical protein